MYTKTQRHTASIFIDAIEFHFEEDDQTNNNDNDIYL